MKKHDLIFSTIDVTNETLEPWLEDEMRNLDIVTDHDIVVIAKAQLWNRTRSYVAKIGRNVALVLDAPFRGIDDEEVYCDAHNVRWVGWHHDGQNSAVYREMKKDDDSFYESFLSALHKAEGNDKAWSRVISRYTRSLRPRVAEIYGW